VAGPVPRLRDLVVAGLLYAAILFAVFSVLDPGLLARGETDARAFAGLQLVDDSVLAGVGLAFGRRRFPGSWSALGLVPVRGRWVGIALVGGIGAAAAAWAASVALGRWGLTAPVQPVETVLDAARDWSDVLFVFLTVTVPVPLAEEVFFRGFAYRLLRARWGPTTAIGLTAVGFALMHGVEPAAWLPVVPVGLVFALLAEGSGSLGAPILAHSVVNALAVLAQ